MPSKYATTRIGRRFHNNNIMLWNGKYANAWKYRKHPVAPGVLYVIHIK